jgi:hypothetical protein
MIPTAAERMRRYRKRRAKTLRAVAARTKFAGKQSKIVAKASAFPAGIRYPVILADPPWRFEPWSRETGMDRAADAHYKTMTVD